MTTTPPAVPQESPPPGYVSQESKRRFTITAGIFATLFFLAQFVVPMVLMLAAMPLMMNGMFENMKIVSGERGAYWGGRLWYVEQGVGMPEGEVEATLNSIVPGDEEPAAVAELPVSSPYLLAGSNRLWIVSSEGVMSYRDGVLATEGEGDPRGAVSRPFLLAGRPAVIEHSPSGLGVLVFTEGGWVKSQDLPRLTKGSERIRLGDDLLVVADDHGQHLFLSFNDTVYYLEGLPEADEEVSSRWQVVRRTSSNWNAALLGGRPTLFVQEAGNGESMWTSSLGGWQRAGGRWQRTLSIDQSVFAAFGVYPAEEPGRFLVLASSMPGSFRVLELQDADIVSNTRYGRGFPYPTGMLSFMFFPYAATLAAPLILAFIYTPLMKRHRICEFRGAGRSVPFASLARRAIAQGIDGIIAGGPAAAGYAMMMYSVFDIEKMMTKGPLFMFSGFALVFAGLAWGVLCFFLFAYGEGRWGVTPGKRALKIRVVGTDLAPCGFGRALLRGVLLMFVDGFMNFMVGVIAVALTEDWQRVGDMVARTIVIEARRTGKARFPS